LDPGRREQIPSEPCHLNVVVPEHALVGEVVDREERGQPAEVRIVAIERAQVDRDEAGLPIVAMDDLRLPALPASVSKVQQALQPAPAEEDEALAIVPVVAVARPVELLSAVVA